MQNHVIDSNYFYDAIEQFAFNYTVYVVSNKVIDDYGRVTSTFSQHIIRGSLQSSGSSLNQSKDGNTKIWLYNFYCKSLYRLNIGDVINYKDKWLLVTNVQDFDEWGVRSAALSNIQLSEYKDLQEYVKYLQGDILV